MISVETHRHGLLVVAATVNDNRQITTAVGFTAEHATQRLLRKLG